MQLITDRGQVQTQNQELNLEFNLEPNLELNTESINTENTVNLVDHQNTKPRMTEQLFKPAKPHTFDGSDTTLVAVKTWTYTVEEYMEFAKIPATNQTRVAAMFLTDTAKMWYINTYVIPETPLLDLKTFLVA